MGGSGLMIKFENDDAAYLEWLAAHPGGYVVNVRRKASPDYIVLHRANCPHISRPPAVTGAYTERGYRKVCSEDQETLRKYARSEGRSDGSFSTECGQCKPLE